MSRVGRTPIPLPPGIAVKVQKNSVLVEKGSTSLTQPLPEGITCTVSDKEIVFARYVEIAGRDFDKRIADRLHCDLASARAHRSRV